MKNNIKISLTPAKKHLVPVVKRPVASQGISQAVSAVAAAHPGGKPIVTNPSASAVTISVSATKKYKVLQDKKTLSEMANGPSGQRCVYKVKKDVWLAGTLVHTEEDSYFIIVFDSQREFAGAKDFPYDNFGKVKILPGLKKSNKTFTDKDVELLSVPDYRTLVDLVIRATGNTGDMTSSDRQQVLDALVHEAQSTTLPLRSKQSGGMLYRAIKLPAEKLRNIIRSGKVKPRADKLSLWVKFPRDTATNLNQAGQGVVIEWNPPSSAIAIDLSAIVLAIKGNTAAVEKLGNASAQKRFHDLVSYVTYTNAVILRAMPLQSPVSSLITANTRFRKLCANMNIPFKESADGRYIVVDMFSVKPNAHELGLD